jgi:CRP/FNR family transcriptional regulator
MPIDRGTAQSGDIPQQHENTAMDLMNTWNGQSNAEPLSWNVHRLAGTLDRWKQLVGQTAAVRRCGPETLLLSENSPARRSYLVEEGVLALSHHLSTGKQVFLTLRSRGQVFGHSRHVLNHSFELSASALTDCVVRTLDSQWLIDQIKGGGDAGVLLMEQHAFDLYESAPALIDLVHLDASARLRKFLIQFAAAAGLPSGDEMHVKVPLTDGYLASLLGISPQQFSAVKRKLASEGKVRHMREKQTWIISTGHHQFTMT